MINSWFAKHLWRRLQFLSLLSVTMLIFACDDYNIVEPRFYDEDDLVEFAECEGDPFAEPIANTGSIGVVQKNVVPAGYTVDACWFNRADGILAVFIALPAAGSFTVSLLNSGGGVEAVIYEGVIEAGSLVVPWVVEEDGVYALSLQVDQWSVVVWFEVK